MVNSSDFETDVGTMDVYARGADPVYVTAPSSLQQEDGVKPLDRLPAQWWNWFLHEATSRFANYKSYISNALAELDNLLDLSAITPDDTKTNQLKGMFENDYLQKYLPEVVSDASTFSVDAAKESSILVSNDDGNNGFAVKKVPYSPCLIYNAQSITTVKTIALPANSPYDGQCFKVVFKNGHNCADSSTPMTLNGKPVLVNVDGVLSALPIHEMEEGGATEYKSLQANTVLDIYYDANYDGNNNDGFVIIGNPVVLSSAYYTIYANGQVDYRGVRHRNVVTNNYSQTVNDMTVDGKLGVLDLFFYNDSNSWRSGDTIGVISDPNLRPKYNFTVAGIAAPRFSTLFPATYQIKTSGEIIIEFVSSSVTSVGELSFSCVIPLS